MWRNDPTAIRKVLGARTRDVLRLLLWDFARPVLVASLIALAIVVGTITGHAIRVARTRPIQALRYE